MFGGAGSLDTLQSFVGASHWGKDLNGASVNNLATMQAAISQARHFRDQATLRAAAFALPTLCGHPASSCEGRRRQASL